MKAILVIDIPNYCLDCPCYNKSKLYCQVMNEMFTDEISNKPSWCPLKPLPQPMETETLDIGLQNWEHGWNAYRKELLGEEE